MSDLDVGRLRLETEALQTRAHELEAAIADSQTRLAALTGLRVPEHGWRPEPLTGQPLGPPALATEHPDRHPARVGVADRPERPELLAAMERQRQATLEKRLAARQSVPDLRITAGYSRIDPGYDGFVWSVSAVIPLFGRNDAAAAAAAVEERLRERRTEALERRIEAERQRAWTAYASATSALRDLAPTNEPDLVETARIAYAEGALGVTGLLDTVQAQLESTLRRIEMERRRADGWFLWQWAFGRDTDNEVTR